ncbi:MAG: excinuclease ABC subunit C [Acidobacteriota bacterium]|nr:excinuclease ABC subunit C [Acidobacteriota bacterium]
MAASFHFEHSVAFSPEGATDILRAIPALPGIFALHGPRAEDQPYLTRAADLRRRITRILAPPEQQSKRLNLRDRVARIEYTITGSEFESTLALYHASAAVFGLDEARRRLKLRTPFFLRFTAENAYPRVYSTNRLSKRSLDNFYGPFPSRAAADRFCDSVLDLFKLRRCYEELAPYPEHPGCVYGEMNKCLAPCNQACTPEGAAAYEAEAAAVKRFFDTRGESMIVDLGLEREEASAAMKFEKAAELHAQWHKVKAAQALADELVQPIPKLRAIIVQKASSEGTGSREQGTEEPEAKPEAAIFLMQSGCITGPARLSTLGVRAVKEQTSVGSSLFAQPLMLQAIPLDEPTPEPVILSEAETVESKDSEEARLASNPPALSVTEPAITPTLSPEVRATDLIASLEEKASSPTDLATLSDHLSLLRRWYYRPEKQRTGEVFLPNINHEWPIRRILNGAARAVLGAPKAMADTQRDLAQRNDAEPELQPARTKILHAGRPDVERVVPVIDKPAFKSRRKTQST